MPAKPKKERTKNKPTPAENKGDLKKSNNTGESDPVEVTPDSEPPAAEEVSDQEPVESTQPPEEVTQSLAEEGEPEPNTDDATGSDSVGFDEVPANTKLTAVPYPHEEVLNEYIAYMRPTTPVTEDIINQQQIKLHTALSVVFGSLTGKQFTEAYDRILQIVNMNRETFSEKYVFRGIASMNIPPKSRLRFELLLTIITATANPVNRAAALKTLDIKRLSSTGVCPEDIVQKLLAFYK